MRVSALAVFLCIALGLPMSANADSTEGRDLARLAFSSLDTTERGFIDQGQFLNYGEDVFVSMDANDDGKLTLAEFLAWDYGMLPLAEEAGRKDAYETALRVVFAFWDRDGDGEISRTEHRQSLNFDFQRADLDGNAVLTEDEFLGGFSVMVALRAAINPEPIE